MSFKSGKKISIVFFCLHRYLVSGGLFYFHKLAEFFSKFSEYEVYIVNYADSEYTKKYKEEHDCTKINFLNYEDKKYKIDENTIFFTCLNMLPLLLEKFKDNKFGKIFLVNFNTQSHLYLKDNLLIKNNENFSKIIKMIDDKNAIAYLDKSCLDVIADYCNIKPKNHFLPAFAEKVYPEYENKNLISEKEINIGILCRLEADKIDSVMNILENIYNTELNTKINVHLIGDGNCAEKINNSNYLKKFNLIHIPCLEGEELRDYLSSEVDILFNFGAAALEAASLKIPAAIPMFIDKTQKISDTYYFLFDTKGYILGCFEYFVNKYNIKTYSMNEILELVYKKKQKNLLGNKCFNYLINNHMPENTAKKFIEYAKSSELTISDCLQNNEIRRIILNFHIYKKLGYNWDDYVNIRQEKLKYKLYSLVCKMYDKKQHLTEYEYKISRYFIKRLILHGIELNVKIFSKYESDMLEKLQDNYNLKIKSLKKKYQNKEKINAAFMITYDGVFPAEPLFQKMLNNDMFNSFIIVIPDISRGKENMYHQMERTYKFLSEKYGKNYVYKSWDDNNKKFIDFSDNMDIVCSANPYDDMTHDFYRTEFLAERNILPIYFNYGYPSIKYAKKVAALDSLSKMWKIFSESDYIIKEYAESMKIKGGGGEICVLAGYMKMDALSEQKIIPRKRKCIIIAPHHTIETKCITTIGLSNFLKYYDLFLKLPELYSQIDFIFRPHPLLRVTLEKETIWGKEKTNKYFEDIQKYKNLIYQKGGDYFETFMNSDGIIHDCSSFLAEYMFTGKPVCYMLRNKHSIDKYFMENGKRILDNCYKAFSEKDIIYFLNDVILKGNDTKLQTRIDFTKKELMVNYPNVSDFVLNHITEHFINKTSNKKLFL